MKRVCVILLTLAMILSFSNVTNADLNEGLIAYWSFDNQSDLGHDDTGNGHDGLSYGSPQWISNGRSGGAIAFDGIDDFIDIDPNGLRMNSAEYDYSVSAWARPHSSQFAFFIQPMYLAGGTDTEFGPVLSWNGKYTNGFCAYYGNSYTQPCNSDLQLDLWYHVVGVYYKDQSIKLFINGVEVASGSTNRFFDVDINNFTIGGDFAGRYVNADLDEVYIYDRALSEAEIQELYLLGLQPIDILVDLIDKIVEINEIYGILNNQDQKFENALEALQDANANNDNSVIGRLNSLINVVTTQLDHNNISDDEAAILISMAKVAITKLEAQ